ncbi:MAG: CHASE2 domain-containing protein [Pseudomonadota bacterium]|nr:CHASE2 domain-containing protein [Pseudomonadota bacterium]
MNAARLMLEWAVLLALAIGGTLYSQANGLTGRIDNQIFDTVSTVARAPLADDIVIVTIDDPSLAEIGAWPWSRAVHGQLVDRANEAGARLVVLDILFIEPTTTQEDASLAEAMERAGAVFLPHTFTQRLNAIEGVDPLLPLPALLSASAGVGHVVAEPDADGVLRRFDLNLATDQGRYPHLAMRVVDALDTDVPKGQQQALIAFHHEDSFPRISAAEVLANAVPQGFLKDKILLVGATAPGMGDRYSVAAGNVDLMSGVATQANLLNALRQGAIITPLDYAVQAALAVALLFGLFLAFWNLPPRYVLICAVAAILFVLVVSVTLLTTANMWFAPGSIMVAVLLAYPLWSWRRLSHVSRYLDREAARLITDEQSPASGETMDYVTRQVEKLRRLISTVRGSLSFLREVIEAAPDAILVLDRDGQVDMLNERAQQLFPNWEGPGKASFTEIMLFAGARQVRNGAELETSDGRTFLIARAELAVADDEDRAQDAGRGGGQIIALRDVSELRRLDDERKQMLEFLSHDMRTPQVAIVGLTEKSGGVGANRDTVRRIRLQAERTLKLADDFVQLARLETPNLEIVDCDVGALIEEACDRAYGPAEGKKITLDQLLPEDPCFAHVDPSLIARMFDNLIGNAIKYSEPETTITLSLTCNGDTFTVKVADQGPGLSDARLANPFARFGAHATHAGPSAGLGLALVKKVVDNHKGQIELESAPGEGTTFTITIPENFAG